MNISQKCNCCIHEEVCSITNKYYEYRTSIVNVANSYGDDFEVSIKCKHCKPKSTKLDKLLD